MLFMSTIYFKSSKPYWCSTDKPLGPDLNDLPWAPQEPDNLFVPERALAYFYLDTHHGIGDANGITAWPFVCQYP